MRNQNTNSRHASNAIPPKHYGSAEGADVCTRSASDEPKQLREIPERIERLFDRTEALSMHIAKISARLEPVMVLHPECVSEKKTVMFDTQLGGQLGELAARIDLMIEAVNTLETQLEL
jgi:hypothetical protein